MFKPTFFFHPGEDIGEELETRGRTQRQFADIIGISAPELNKIIKGKKNLTPALAVRIGEAFGTSAEFWMNMQMQYSLDLAKKEVKRLKRVHEKLKEYGFEDLSSLDDATLEKVLLKEEEKSEQKSQNTILNNPERYIPIRVGSAISRRRKKGYTIKYIRASNLKKKPE